MLIRPGGIWESIPSGSCRALMDRLVNLGREQKGRPPTASAPPLFQHRHHRGEALLYCPMEAAGAALWLCYRDRGRPHSVAVFGKKKPGFCEVFLPIGRSNSRQCCAPLAQAMAVPGRSYHICTTSQ